MWEREVELTSDMKIKQYNTLNVNPLPNFMKGYPITDNKCWFNSVMINLYNSEVFQKVINELASKAKNKSASPSYWIKQIFNNIKTGDMKNYVENLNGLAKVVDVHSNFDIDDKNCPMNAYGKIIHGVLNEAESSSIAITDKLVTTRSSKTIYDCGHHEEQISYLTYFKIDNRFSISNIIDVSDGEICSKCNSKSYQIRNMQKILAVPQLLSIKTNEGDALKQTISINDRKGIHLYKLIGVVDGTTNSDDGHYVAKLKLEDGEFYNLDDLNTENVTKIKFDRKNKYRTFAFYEIVL